MTELATRLFGPWVRLVNAETLRADFIAGILGALLVLPQGFAFATLAGLPPISANATSSIVQFPGYVTSTLAYWSDIRLIWRTALLLCLASAAGALLGALVLLALDNGRARTSKGTDGEPARLSSRTGAVVAPVEVTDAVMPGVVSLPHGWGHGAPGTVQRIAADHAGANSNELADELLLDELSGNAVLNGIPVELAAVATDSAR